MKKTNREAVANMPPVNIKPDYRNQFLKDTRKTHVLGFRLDDNSQITYTNPSLKQKADINRVLNIKNERDVSGNEYRLLFLMVIHGCKIDGKPIFHVEDLDSMLDLPDDSPVAQLALEVADIIAKENAANTAAVEAIKKN